MSIINKMLQDLDRRQGMSSPDGAIPPQQVRAVPVARGDRQWFWRIIAVLMIAAVGWVAWIAWRLQPGDAVVTALAFKAAEDGKRSPSVAQAPAAVAAVPAPAPAPAPTPAPVTEPAKPAPQAAEAPKQAAEPAPPIREQPKREAAARERSQAASAAVVTTAAAPAGAAKPAPKAGGPTRLDLDLPPARILQAPVQSAGRVQKLDRARSADERAESEFRRGAALLNQGRVSEAEESFVAALALSSSHEAARQALVALNLEQRRIDDARRLLQEGVAINPANVQFALVLARIHAERREFALALEVLNGAGAQSNPEFHALAGTVLQRLGRHGEASDAFRAALRGAPGNGAAWAGLGISLEAQGQRPDAAEAFRRALAATPTGSELSNFAEQRLRALR